MPPASNILSSEVGHQGILFLSSLALFRSCSNLILVKPVWTSAYRKAFQEQLESYLLWGNHFDPSSGQLDRILIEATQELRDGVQESMGNICKILCHRFLSFFEKPPSSSIGRNRHFKALENQTECLKLLDYLQEAGLKLETPTDDVDCMKYVLEDIKCIIDLLHETVPSLDDVVSQLDNSDFRETPADPADDYTLSGPAASYYSKIRDRFPKIDIPLAQRLAASNWQRYANFHEVHTNDKWQYVERSDSSNFDRESHAIASTNFHDSGLGTTLRTASKYASSEVSFESFIASQADVQGAFSRLPPLPEERPFLCSICRTNVKDVHNKKHWSRHVYADLRAYDCILASCGTNLPFSSRVQFAEHMAVNHRYRSTWKCADCDHVAPDSSDFRQHVESGHPKRTKQELESMIVSCEIRSLRDLEYEMCPFCREIPTSKGFIGHVSHHLEEIALSVLPSSAYPESDTDDNTNSEMSMSGRVLQEQQKFLIRSGGSYGALFEDAPSVNAKDDCTEHHPLDVDAGLGEEWNDFPSPAWETGGLMDGATRMKVPPQEQQGLQNRMQPPSKSGTQMSQKHLQELAQVNQVHQQVFAHLKSQRVPIGWQQTADISIRATYILQLISEIRRARKELSWKEAQGIAFQLERQAWIESADRRTYERTCVRKITSTVELEDAIKHAINKIRINPGTNTENYDTYEESSSQNNSEDNSVLKPTSTMASSESNNFLTGRHSAAPAATLFLPSTNFGIQNKPSESSSNAPFAPSAANLSSLEPSLTQPPVISTVPLAQPAEHLSALEPSTLESSVTPPPVSMDSLFPFGFMESLSS